MNMIPTVSSSIEAYGYDAALKRLRVRFKGGEEWDYIEATQETYDELHASDSKGKFFHSKIRPLHDGVRTNCIRPDEEPEKVLEEELKKLRNPIAKC